MSTKQADNKSHILTYEISQIVPYINWPYLYHAWSLSGKPQGVKDELRKEALEMLAKLEGKYHTHAVFALCDANSDGDDLLVGDCRIPMLRQQEPAAPGSPNLCLADFIRPAETGIKDMVGIFATTVDAALTADNEQDPYQRMLSQTLADRLAEGTAERMHEEVRRKYWAYAPDERLTMKETHAEKYQGIRPAIGYPSLPDTSVNFLLAELIDMKGIGISLTESGMMIPHASVSGFMFAHPQSQYFELGKIGEDQLQDYARRRGMPIDAVRKFLSANLLKK
ncbi:MAG: 5-methyltetrahydrofolate--homocysteine methyltransferase [Prevotella sp.]|nr:5-methyltetrahydrofolate--homocysteine methyltransferase [Prevotella sp.]